MKKLTTIDLVWKYLSELAKTKKCKKIRVAVGEIAQAVNRSERMVQLVMHQLGGKVERVFREKQGLTYKTIIKNYYNEYIIHEFYPVISPTKSLKAFKVFKEKDLKAEEEKFSPSHNDSPDIHITTENRTSELPLLIERNLPHLVQGYAFTVVDFVMNKFKRLLKMGKITHMIAWIRGALANEQAIYDAIGFDMYISRGKQADRNKSASTSAPKSAPRAKMNRPSNRSSNRSSNRPSRPSLPMPVYESPVVEQSEVERILAMAREYQKEKTACAV